MWALELGRSSAFASTTTAHGDYPLRKGLTPLAATGRVPALLPHLPVPTAPFISSSLSYLSAPQPLYRNSSGQAFNSARASQAKLFSGVPYSLGFASNSTLSLDDAGLVNAAAVKELTLRVNAAAARAAVTLLTASAARHPKPFADFALLNRNDAASRFLQAHQSRVAPALAPSALPFTTKLVSAQTLNWSLTATATAAGEIGSARKA